MASIWKLNLVMTHKFIIESFWQKANNCAAIVLIKAAILHHHLHKVFKHQRKYNQWLITLKNKQILILSDTDIRRINKGSKISYRRYRNEKDKQLLKTLKEYTQLCFAVIVRNLQMNGYEGEEFTETSAIKRLTSNGISTAHLYSLLGLSRKTANKLSTKHLPTFQRKKAVLLYTDTHITIASGGYYEDFGAAVEITNTIPLLNGRKAKYWFELK